MKRQLISCLLIAGMAPLSTVQAHEGYHTFFTHLDPATTVFILCCAVGVPLLAYAVRKHNRSLAIKARRGRQ